MQRTRPTSATSHIHSAEVPRCHASRALAGARSSISRAMSLSSSVLPTPISRTLMSPSARTIGRDCATRYTVEAPRAAATRSSSSIEKSSSGCAVVEDVAAWRTGRRASGTMTARSTGMSGSRGGTDAITGCSCPTSTGSRSDSRGVAIGTGASRTCSDSNTRATGSGSM